MDRIDINNAEIPAYINPNQAYVGIESLSDLTIKDGVVLSQSELSVKTPKKRQYGKPFTKNDPRLNKNGRPKGSKDFKKLFFESLAELRTDKNKPIKEKDFIKMGINLMFKRMQGDRHDSHKYTKFYMDTVDRVYGKPTENVDITTQGQKLPAPTIVGVRIVKE